MLQDWQFQTETTVSYSTTGKYQHEIVVCTNTSGITITMQAIVEGKEVTVIRAGTGAVTVDGNGTNITGAATQVIPVQYDAPHMIATSSEWVLG